MPVDFRSSFRMAICVEGGGGQEGECEIHFISFLLTALHLVAASSVFRCSGEDLSFHPFGNTRGRQSINSVHLGRSYGIVFFSF